MIALLSGRVAAASLGRVVVDVGGVGYRVLVPPGMGARVGSTLTLHTYLAVRDDALTLYGFPTEAERELFEVLLSVTGIGPKTALAAIATLGAVGLGRAVVTEDVAALVTVPGIGRKSAQRMILELRERLGALPDDAIPSDGAPPGDGLDPREEVRQALAALGYAPAEVQRTLASLPAPEADGAASPGPAHDGRGRSAEELLRLALRSLGAGR